MAMTADVDEIFSGPATISLAEIVSGVTGSHAEIGVVQDVRITVEKATRDELGEEYGTAVPHNVFKDGTNYSVRCNMMQTVRENLEILTGGHGGAGYIYGEDRPGREPVFEIVVTPSAGSGGGGTDAATSIFRGYKVVAVPDGDISFARGEDRMYPVTFRGLVDTRRPAGRRMFRYTKPDGA
jgi:hypothetical protein